MIIQTIFSKTTEQAETDEGFEPLRYDSNGEPYNGPGGKPAIPANN